MSNLLISPLVAQQLPEFVRGEYSTFVTFIEKYYEWMEQSGNAIKASDEVQYAQNIDLATDYYIEQIKQEFLPYFPESIALDKRKFLKLVNNFYSSKGTPNSLKFLFKALYNEAIEIYYPKDDILKASDGKWVLPLALRIDTNDNNIFNIEKNLITGLTSKATALVEKVTRSVDRQLGVSYVELYISNVDKIFSTGEIISSTYNNGTVDVTVTGRLIGSLSEIKIDPDNRGLFYNPYDATTGYPGDPVSIVGGLNPTANTPIGAIAYVGETTQGGIPDIIVSNGGFGFRDPLSFANTSIIDFTGGFSSATLGTEARAQISLLDENTYRTINVSNTMISTIISVPISNVENNAISSVSTFQSFNVFPIAFVSVTGQGGGYRNRPEVDVYSFYMENNDDEIVISSTTVTRGRNFITSSSIDFTTFFQPGDQARFFIVNRYEEVLEVVSVTPSQLTFAKNFENDITGVAVYKLNRGDLRKLGSLGRITIVNGGIGYANGDTLTFNGGSGYGANAFVSVNATGTIISATMNNHSSNAFVIGGEGYTMSDLPTITINTATGANAILQVTEIVGDGEQLDLSPSRVGSISKLRISSFGYDYTSEPIISLRNADVTLSNVTTGQIFISNTIVYQGSSNINTTFTAYVDKYDSVNKILRIFDYKGVLNTAAKLICDDPMHSYIDGDVTGVQFYGDGRALATSSFENGLIRLPGLYLNTDGQVSSDKRLQDGKKYHNFSYVINTQNDYYKFKNALNDIVHPTGTKTFVNRIDNNTENVNEQITSNNLIQVTLSDTFNIANGSNNMVCTNTSANVASTVNVGDFIILETCFKPFGNTVSVNNSSNVVTSLANNFNFVNEFFEGDKLIVYRGLTYETFKDVTTQEIGLTGLSMSPTGNTLYIVGTAGDDITFYNLSTPWSVDTATFVSQRTLLPLTTSPLDMFFKPDGTKLWVTSAAPAINICTYTLSQPWNVQTMVANTETYSLASVTTNPSSIYWKPDGTKYYISSSAGTLNDTIIEYTVSQNWNVATSTLSNRKNIGTEELTVTGLTFNSDGTKMFIVGSSGNELNYYRLNIPWNIASAYFIKNIPLQTTPIGMYYAEEIDKLYISHDTGSVANTNRVLQYNFDFDDTINTIKTVDDYYSISMENNFSYTSNSAFIEKIYSQSGFVNVVNNTTILLNTRFDSNSSFITASVQKVK